MRHSLQSHPFPFRLECRDVTYVTPNKREILNGLSLVLEGSDRAALVGRNGVGKTTLARLLAGELEPTAGDILLEGQIGYVPQRLPETDRGQTVAEFLGVARELAALARATRGEMDPEDASLLSSAWDLEERLQKRLALLGIGHLSAERTLSTVSGGELRRLFLARVHDADFIILDEPTNDLDVEARAGLRNWLKARHGGWLVISHDRDLLALANGFAELREQGLRTYAGSYEQFLAEREHEEALLAASITQQEREIRLGEATKEISLQRQHRRTQKAEAEVKDKGINRTLIQLLKERAQKTAVRLRDTHEDRLEAQREALAQARARVRLENRIAIPMPETAVAPDLTVIAFKGLDFGWPSKEETPLLRNIDFTLEGPERVALVGRNGSGKTTLLRLMAGDLEPTSGIVSWGTQRIAYLDQQADLLDDGLTLEEIVRRARGTQDLDEVRELIAVHRFPASMAGRAVATLSGGERLRAGLVAALASRHPPQLLLLDEPTNNLDLGALEALESALCSFEGALVVVSHEETFLRNIGVSRFVSLEGGASRPNLEALSGS